jgi:hypothetical protein
VRMRFGGVMFGFWRHGIHTVLHNGQLRSS